MEHGGVVPFVLSNFVQCVCRVEGPQVVQVADICDHQIRTYDRGALGRRAALENRPPRPWISIRLACSRGSAAKGAAENKYALPLIAERPCDERAKVIFERRDQRRRGGAWRLKSNEPSGCSAKWQAQFRRLERRRLHLCRPPVPLPWRLFFRRGPAWKHAQRLGLEQMVAAQQHAAQIELGTPRRLGHDHLGQRVASQRVRQPVRLQPVVDRAAVAQRVQREAAIIADEDEAVQPEQPDVERERAGGPLAARELALAVGRT